MFRSLNLGLAPIAVLLLSSPVAASQITIRLEDEYGVELEKAFAHLAAGRAAEAESIFATVATAYEQKYADSQVRCARDHKEAALVAGKLLLGSPEDLKKFTTSLETGQGGTFNPLVMIDDTTILGPGWCDAIFGRAFALIDLHRLDEAEPLLVRAIGMAPTRAHYLNEYGELFKSRRQWERSYNVFARAWEVARSGPDTQQNDVKARALRGMGFTKIELGDLDEAQRLFNRSLELQPNHAGALSELKYIADRRAAAK